MVQTHVIKNGMNDHRLVPSGGDLGLFIRFWKWTNGLDHAQIVSPTGARAQIGSEPDQVFRMFSADLFSIVFPDY